MMLKTLKEIDDGAGKDGKADDLIVFRSDLKEEAIKWIKEFRKTYIVTVNNLEKEGKIKKPTPESTEKGFGLLRAEGAMEFIKQFFNIKEEDLK